jgi:hypothetical protein
VTRDVKWGVCGRLVRIKEQHSVTNPIACSTLPVALAGTHAIAAACHPSSLIFSYAHPCSITRNNVHRSNAQVAAQLQWHTCNENAVDMQNSQRCRSGTTVLSASLRSVATLQNHSVPLFCGHTKTQRLRRDIPHRGDRIHLSMPRYLPDSKFTYDEYSLVRMLSCTRLNIVDDYPKGNGPNQLHSLSQSSPAHAKRFICHMPYFARY